MLASVSIVLPVLADAEGQRAVGTVDALVRNCPQDRVFDLILVVSQTAPAARDLLTPALGSATLVEVPAGTTYGAACLAAAAVARSEQLLLTSPQLPALWDDLSRALSGRVVPGELALVDRDLLLGCGDVAALGLEPAAVSGLARLRATPAAPAPQEPAGAVGDADAAPAVPRQRVPDLTTVVVLAPQGAACVAGLLEQVRATKVRHEVVVVDGRAAQAGTWPGRADVRVIPAGGAGAVAGAELGLRAARGRYAVLLQPSSHLGRFWLEGLHAARGEGVGAVGARCTGGPVPQGVRGSLYGSPAELRTFREQWRRDHRGQVVAVDVLTAAPCLLDLAAVDAAGPLDAGFLDLDGAVSDLTWRIAAAGWSLRIADEVYVHRDAPAVAPREWHREPPVPTGAEPLEGPDRVRHDRRRLAARHGWGAVGGSVSATLIVKDEQRLLPSCLAALVGLVDEVVVCDTGSGDATVEVATAAGARVVFHAWSDDFAAARNVAVDAAQGVWCLVVDADELVHCEDQVLYESMLDGSDVDVVGIGIVNYTGRSGQLRVGGTHRARRLFRRATCHFVHRVHEQVVRRDASLGTEAGTDCVFLWHYGYLDSIVVDKNKWARNHKLAAVRTAEDEGTWESVYELGRSLFSLEEWAGAEDALTRAVDEAPHGCEQWQTSQILLCELMFSTGRPELGEEHAAAAHTVQPNSPRNLLSYALALKENGSPERALEILQAATLPAASVDAGGVLRVRSLAGVLLSDLRRDREAREQLTALAVAHCEEFGEWPTLLQVMARTGSGEPAFLDLLAAPPLGLVQALLTADAQVREGFQQAVLASAG